MEQEKVNRTRRLVLWVSVVFLSVIVVGTLVIRLIFSQQDPLPTTGEYAVDSVFFSFTDENRVEQYSSTGRYRKVNVEFWYPENMDGIFPLVIFSHGALGIRSSNLSLYHELASHGYVVGALDHPDQAFWTNDTEGRLTLLSLDYLADLQREDAKTDKVQSLAYYQDWMSTRMGDINLVLDTVIENAKDGKNGVYGLVDTEKIGMMGHSLGGSAALGIGRQRDEIKAVIALEAPFLYDIIGVEDGEFVFLDVDYPTPVLNVYSDDSWDDLADWAQYAMNDALLSEPNATAFNVHISGVGHLALTDLALSSPLAVRLLDRSPMTRDNAEALHIINRISLEFFNYFLKGSGDLPMFQADNDN
jgi:dienelactone hydrolase